MMNSKTNKKQLIIFLIVAYGVTYLMGLLMWYGNTKQLDLSAFANTQMMYPAAGVMLAYLLTRRDDLNLPKWFYRVFILITVLMLISTIMTVFQPEKILETAGGNISFWLMAMQIFMMGGSILCWIFLLAAGKKRRAAYGLKWQNWKTSLLCIVLFLILYFLRVGISFTRIRSIGNIHIHSNQSGHMDLYRFHADQLPVSLCRLLRRRIWMAVLSAADFAETFRTPLRRAHSRCCVGLMALTCRPFLLYITGTGPHHADKPDHHLRYLWHIFRLCLYADK